MEEHLRELLEGTSSSQMKLLAAWDGLSIETQIKLLHGLANGKRLHLTFHRDVIARALKSPNEYIRYFAARSRDLEKDNDMAEQIAADESPLVRYAQDELRTYWPGTINSVPLATALCDFPKARQLAVVRAEFPPFCSDFAEFLMCAIERRGATDEALSDVVYEYVTNPEVKNRRHQHEYLWKIIPKMPDGVVWKFVANLSAEGLDREVLIPHEVLAWLQGDLLTWFLSREDVCLEEFRKRVFQSNDGKYSDGNRIAAAGINFMLTFQEFDGLLKDQPDRPGLLACLEDQRSESIKFFWHFRRPLPLDNFPLVFNECIRDNFAAHNKKEKMLLEHFIEGSVVMKVNCQVNCRTGSGQSFVNLESTG